MEAAEYSVRYHEQHTKRNLMKRSLRLGTAVIALALIAAACGGGDNLAEAIVNSQTDGNVNISNDGQTITFETEDGTGTINTDGEGNISFEGTDESGGQISLSGAGGEVPSDFPLPIAPGGTVGLTMNSPEGELYTITYPNEVFDQLAEMYTEYMTNTPGEESISSGTFEGLKSFFAKITLDDGTTLSASISQSDTETIVTLGRSKNP